MIRRRDFLKAAMAAAISPKLIHGAPPDTMRVHCKEIAHSIWEDRILINGRVLSWSTNDVEYMPKVGTTLQIEHKNNNTSKMERFRVVVTKHEKLQDDPLKFKSNQVLLTTAEDEQLFAGTH